MNSAIFIDRDGTIIKERNYTYKPDEVELLPTVAEAIKLMKDKGFKIIVVTNQSGIGRGYFSLQEFQSTNARLFELLKANSEVRHRAEIDKIYFCPHRPEDNCECRKPKPGMVNQAVSEFNIDLKSSYIIGDRSEDIELGKCAGLQATILVLTGYGKETARLSNLDFCHYERSEEARKVLSGEFLSERGKSTLRPVQPDFIAHTLLEAANWICGQIK